MNALELEAQIEALRVENIMLKARKAKKDNPKPSLQNIPDPDPKQFVSAENIADLLVEHQVLPKAEKNDARNFLKLFCLKALAQSKAVGDKGRGKLLFMTGDVMDAIKHLRSFPGQGQ